MPVEVLNTSCSDLDTTIQFIGDNEDELIVREEDYMMDYHPCGYSTKRKNLIKRDDGKWILTIWRMNSCD
tara:strand:- start:111 stop:320 length:210 start_codon:yes stop_codon:yes gene_type:complete